MQLLHTKQQWQLSHQHVEYAIRYSTQATNTTQHYTTQHNTVNTTRHHHTRNLLVKMVKQRARTLLYFWHAASITVSQQFHITHTPHPGIMVHTTGTGASSYCQYVLLAEQTKQTNTCLFTRSWPTWRFTSRSTPNKSLQRDSFQPNFWLSTEKLNQTQQKHP